MGSFTGVQKIAAKRIGIPFDEYLNKIESGLKWCTACKTWKPSTRFDVDRSRGSGLAAACIDCRRVKVKKARKDQPPSKEIQGCASSAVAYAIKCGRMVKPTLLPCADCGKPAQQYHHHLGYDRSHWLDVTPLCRSCHRKRHFE